MKRLGGRYERNVSRRRSGARKLQGEQLRAHRKFIVFSIPLYHNSTVCIENDNHI